MPDGTVLGRDKTFTKEWQIQNTGNVPLKNVTFESATGTGQSGLNYSRPTDIAEWKIGEIKTISISLETQSNTPANTYKQSWNIFADGKNLLYTSGAKAFVSFSLVVPDFDPILTVVKFNPLNTDTSKAVAVKVRAVTGVAPYNVSIQFEKGTLSTEQIQDSGNSVTLSHTFSDFGSYEIEVRVTDATGRKSTTRMPVTVVKDTAKTNWLLTGKSLFDNHNSYHTSFGAEEKTQQTLSYAEYYANWAPLTLDDANYFSYLRLPVPKDVLQTKHKIRLTYAVNAGALKSYDRIFGVKTSAYKEITANIISSGYSSMGNFTVEDLATDFKDVQVADELTDTYESGKDYFYALEIDNGVVNVQRFANNAYQTLQSYPVSDLGEYLTEIFVGFKGNGKLKLLKLDYDANGDGEYEGGEGSLLNTTDKSVDWPNYSWTEGGEQPTEIVSNVKVQANGVDGFTVTWDKLDSAQSYNLYYAESSFEGVDIANYASVQGAVMLPNITNLQQSITGLSHGKTYYVVVTSVDVDGVETTKSDEVVVTLTSSVVIRASKLNDTGIAFCGIADGPNDTIYKAKCAAAVANAVGSQVPLGQDGHYATGKDGSNGMVFTKVKGYEAQCVQDEHTGLMWEVKQTEQGLHDKDNTYTWYNPYSSTNGGRAGVQNGGACSGSDCDTDAFVKEVNRQGLCGYSDWRMPTPAELFSITNLGRVNPSIDAFYFPNTIFGPLCSYWTSTTFSFMKEHAWFVYFGSGSVNTSSKDEKNCARLVRSR